MIGSTVATPTYWDKVNYAKWGQYLLRIERASILKAHALAGRPATAIDIGCGSGNWSELLSTLGWQLVCIDVDQQSLDTCKIRTPGAACILADPSANVITAESNSARLLLCVEVEIILQDWFQAEVLRVLADGGIFVGVCWNRSSLRGLAWRLKHFPKNAHSKPAYYQLQYASWRSKLVRAGFEFLHEEGFCWPPFQRSSNSFLIPAFAKMERLLLLNRWIRCSPWIAFIARK
jgi:SAM-dependent methyltransferase